MVGQLCICGQLCECGSLERMMHSQLQKETQGKRKVKEFAEDTG